MIADVLGDPWTLAVLIVLVSLLALFLGCDRAALRSALADTERLLDAYQVRASKARAERDKALADASRLRAGLMNGRYERKAKTADEFVPGVRVVVPAKQLPSLGEMELWARAEADRSQIPAVEDVR